MSSRHDERRPPPEPPRRVQYADSEGDFREWHDAPNHDGNGCCPTPKIRFRHWDSHDGAYTDTHVECQSCGKSYWIDGDDG